VSQICRRCRFFRPAAVEKITDSIIDTVRVACEQLVFARLSRRSTAAVACGGFAAGRSAGRGYRSTAEGAVLRSAANAGSVTLRADGGG